jgi:hypothetical protein
MLGSSLYSYIPNPKLLIPYLILSALNTKLDLNSPPILIVI